MSLSWHADGHVGQAGDYVGDLWGNGLLIVRFRNFRGGPVSFFDFVTPFQRSRVIT